MSKETAGDVGTEGAGEESYEDIFNEMVDSPKSGAELDPESDEDTADEAESEEEEDQEDNPDGGGDEGEESADGDQKSEGTPEGWEKRYRDLHSYSDKRHNALASENQELRDRLDALEKGKSEETQGGDTASANDQEGTDFKVDEYLKSLPSEDRELFEDNPSLLKVMTDVVQKMAPKSTVNESTVSELVAKELEAREAARAQEMEAAAIEDAKAKVREAIPDVEEIMTDRDFQIWKADNQTRVADILDRADSDAGGVINVIKYYQSINAMNATKAATKKSTAKGTAGTPKGVSTRATNKPSDDDYDAAFKYYAGR